MTIAIVCYPTFGGSGVVATELGMALAKRNHQVHFIAYKKPVRLELFNENIHFHEVTVPEYPLFKYQPYELALSSRLVDCVKKYKIEILHVHYAIPHAYAGYMAKKMLEEEGIHIPMITTLHGTDITLVGNLPFYKPAVTFSINESDFVTSVSQSLKEDTLRLFNIKNDIEVIPNFIDSQLIPQFTDCQREQIAKSDERIITHISNFRPVKRIIDVIDVYYHIQQKIPSKLLMVGEGPDRVAAKKHCEALGIKDKVLFLGRSNSIDKILCFSDLFLLPSEKESFGLAALEAMMHRAPVISSNSGGIPEVNIHGVSGLLSDVGDITDMAQNAIHILEDDDVLKQFKEGAYQQSLQFDVSKVINKYLSLYKRAIDKVSKASKVLKDISID